MLLAKLLRLLVACTLALFALGVNARPLDAFHAQNAPLEKIELLLLDNPHAWRAQAVDAPEENDCRYDDGASGPTHYNYFRTYQPTQGRYTQADPIGLQGGLNRYSYVEGNPVSRSDPEGLDWYRPQNSSQPYTVGRDGHPIVPPGGAISRLIEQCVPAGRTFGEIHDARVDELISRGVPDWRANFPTMPGAYRDAVKQETGNSLLRLDQNIRNLYRR